MSNYPVYLTDNNDVSWGPVITFADLMATFYSGNGNGHNTTSRLGYTDFIPSSEGTGNNAIDGILGGAKWGNGIGSGVSLTYSINSNSYATSYTSTSYGTFDPPVPQDSWTLLSFNATMQSAIHGSMARFGAVANLAPVQLTGGSGQVGDIRWMHTSEPSIATAFAYFPSSLVWGGDVWFGPGSPEYSDPVVGSYGFHTYIHELGHAMGLKHPHDADAGQVLANVTNDQLKYSIMSYRDYAGDSLNGYNSWYFPTTPMVNDILALQFLYGANMSHRTGNDTYSWDPEGHVYETIWDAGGNDTISAANHNTAVVINLNPGQWSSLGATFWNGQGFVNDTLTIAYGAVIENATGGSGADTLIGNSAANKLDGGAGSDSMTGGDGSDAYYVRDAGDVVTETNADKATGGTDMVYSYVAAYTLGNNVENGRIATSSAANLTGNSLSNVLYAGAGNNVINGGSGTDTVSYRYATAGVTVSLAIATAQATGGSGSDTLASIERLEGSAYNDVLTGNSGANTLTGGAGSDRLDGAAGTDTMVGGDGSDFYYVRDSTDVVTETNADKATGGNDMVYSYLTGYALGSNVENGRIMLSGSANLTGNGLANYLFAGDGNNMIHGGSGSDTVGYRYATAGVTVSLAIGTAQATGGSGSDTLTSIEHLEGSAYNDVLTGNSGANTLIGGGGSDKLDGGTGSDTMIGGDGNDYYYVRDAGDVVTETNADKAVGGTDQVYTYISAYTLGTNVENGRIATSSAANLTGNSLSNVLYAGNGNNVINGGSGTDTVSYRYATAGVTVSLAVGTAQATGGSGSDTLASIERLEGSAYNDTLIGNSGANVLTGGAGKDTMTGAAAADIFDFNALSEMGTTSLTWDVITDFVSGLDKIDLSTLDADTSTGTNDAFNVIHYNGEAFTGARQLRFADGVLYGNVDADMTAEFAIQLSGVTSIAAGDVIV